MHFKLGLFKNFVKGIDQDGCGFRYLQQKFSTKFEAKLKAGIFVGPDIGKLMNNKLFSKRKGSLEPGLLGGQKLLGQL